MTDTPGATAGFLEFKGQGLETFERAMSRNERLMAVLGSRLLEDQKKVGETATAIELRQSGENSILGNIALNVGASLTQVMGWAYWWNSTESVPDDITTEQVLIELNTDFSTKGLASQDTGGSRENRDAGFTAEARRRGKEGSLISYYEGTSKPSRGICRQDEWFHQ